MGVHYKLPEATRNEIVKRAFNGESVEALAKQYKVARPTIYNWKNKAKKAVAEHALAQGKSQKTKELDTSLIKDINLVRLKEENEILRRKLIDLMIEAGRM